VSGGYYFIGRNIGLLIILSVIGKLWERQRELFILFIYGLNTQRCLILSVFYIGLISL
jgi:hypothetical protein